MQSQQRSLVGTSRILPLAPQNTLLVDSTRELRRNHTACSPRQYTSIQPMTAMAARNMPSRQWWQQQHSGTRIHCCRRLESSHLFTVNEESRPFDRRCQPSLTRDTTSQASTTPPRMRRKGFTPRSTLSPDHNARAAEVRTTRTSRARPWGGGPEQRMGLAPKSTCQVACKGHKVVAKSPYGRRLAGKGLPWLSADIADVPRFSNSSTTAAAVNLVIVVHRHVPSGAAGTQQPLPATSSQRPHTERTGPRTGHKTRPVGVTGG